MYRLLARVQKLQRHLEPTREWAPIRVTWAVEGGEEPVFEPGEHVIHVNWDGTATEYIAGETPNHAAP